MWTEKRTLTAGVLAVGLLIVFMVVNVPAAEAQDLLDPATQPKFVNALPNPLDPSFIMQPQGMQGGAAFYEIGMTQFEQALGLVDPDDGSPLQTKLWGYGPPDGNGGYQGTYPARTIEARSHQRIAVKWVNALVDGEGDLLPHLLPVDTTVHCGPRVDPDTGELIPSFCRPLVRTVVHVHGAHVADHSDGYPEAWFTAGFEEVGPAWTRETYEYSNNQEATTLWYHDHALGTTRLNVYAGLAGFYILRDAYEDHLDLPGGPYEIPILIQDRSFYENGSLFYPDESIIDPETNEPFLDPISNEEVPSIVPEFFGDIAVVNGVVWPRLQMEPRKYRFRFLNGSGSRFYNIQLFEYDETTKTFDLNKPGPVFHQIGTDGGLLPAPVTIDGRLLMGPAERADVVMDFSGFEGKSFILHNNAKTPFKGLDQVDDEVPLPEIMIFEVLDVETEDTSSLPATLRRLVRLPERSAAANRELTLNEGTDEFDRLKLLLGTTDLGPLGWDDPITEKPRLGTNEIWNVINLTEDVHPIHLHLVQFQILDRQPFDGPAYLDALEAYLQNPEENPKPVLSDYFEGGAVLPDPNEDGRKDTMRANPGEVTRVIARFDVPGLFVWHCHILEHEDHEMMRPYEVVTGGGSFSGQMPF